MTATAFGLVVTFYDSGGIKRAPTCVPLFHFVQQSFLKPLYLDLANFKIHLEKSVI